MCEDQHIKSKMSENTAGDPGTGLSMESVVQKFVEVKS